MATHTTIDQELARLVAAHLHAATAAGAITHAEHSAAVEAIRHGDVSARRGADGTIEVKLGTAAIVQLHLLDLPSAAAEWETRLTP